jgi:hypothetical protein
MQGIDAKFKGATIGHDLLRNSAPVGDHTSVEENTRTDRRRNVTMQETKTAELSQDSANQDSKRDLNKRYGKIGISAVAAAVRHQGEQTTVGEYRIPFDRD